jgi:hypothetical protein
MSFLPTSTPPGLPAEVDVAARTVLTDRRRDRARVMGPS